MTNAATTPKADTEERRVHAWIGQGVTIEGKIRSAQDLRIDGKVEGTIEVGQHGVIVGASAEIDANLAAKTILVSGTVRGNLTATDRIDIHETASVHGDLTAPRLVIADGALVLGKVDVSGTREARLRSAESTAATAASSARQAE